MAGMCRNQEQGACCSTQMTYKVQGFQKDGTGQLFGTKGKKFLHCPGTKGQQDKLKILPWDRTGQDSLSKSGTGCGTGESLCFWQNPRRDNHYFFPIISCCITSFSILEHLFLFQDLLILFQDLLILFQNALFCFRTSYSCFLVSFEKVILSRDRVVCPRILTPVLVPGQRDKEIFLSPDKVTSCPSPELWDVPSLGNPTMNRF